jgi:CheY-like chemotaxis protein
MTDNSYRILLADDDSDDRYIIHQSFKEIGWEDQVKLFDSGRQLISYLDNLTSSGYPKLIVLDFNIPGMNAAEILHHLKRHDKYKDIAVAVYSSDMNESMEQRLFSMGVLSCFKKPFRSTEIIDLVKSFRQLTEAALTVEK